MFRPVLVLYFIVLECINMIRDDVCLLNSKPVDEICIWYLKPKFMKKTKFRQAEQNQSQVVNPSEDVVWLKAKYVDKSFI